MFNCDNNNYSYLRYWWCCFQSSFRWSIYSLGFSWGLIFLVPLSELTYFTCLASGITRFFCPYFTSPPYFMGRKYEIKVQDGSDLVTSPQQVQDKSHIDPWCLMSHFRLHMDFLITHDPSSWNLPLWIFPCWLQELVLLLPKMLWPKGWKLPVRPPTTLAGRESRWCGLHPTGSNQAHWA